MLLCCLWTVGSFIERTSSKEVVVREADAVNLTCLVNPGNPGPKNRLSISWKVRRSSVKVLGNNIKNEGLASQQEEQEDDEVTENQVEESSLTGSTSVVEEDEGPLRISYLIIKEAKEENYVCTAFNGVGVKDEEEFSVKLMHPPFILDKNVSKTIGIDGTEDSLEVKCRSKGRPLPTFYWFERDRQILGREEFLASSQTSQVNGRFSISDSTARDSVSGEEVRSSRLLIQHLSHEDVNRRFKCLAFNDMGRDEKEILLRRKGKPDAPSNVRVVSSSWNSIHVVWEEGFDGGFTQWFTVQVNDQKEVQVESNEIFLEGLKGGKEFLMNIRAVNEPFGPSLDTVSLVVTTPDKEDSLPDEEDKGQLVSGGPTTARGFLSSLLSNSIKYSRQQQVIFIAIICVVCLVVMSGAFFILLLLRRKNKAAFLSQASNSSTAGGSSIAGGSSSSSSSSGSSSSSTPSPPASGTRTSSTSAAGGSLINNRTNQGTSFDNDSGNNKITATGNGSLFATGASNGGLKCNGTSVTTSEHHHHPFLPDHHSLCRDSSQEEGEEDQGRTTTTQGGSLVHQSHQVGHINHVECTRHASVIHSQKGFKNNLQIQVHDNESLHSSSCFASSTSSVHPTDLEIMIRENGMHLSMDSSGMHVLPPDINTSCGLLLEKCSGFDAGVGKVSFEPLVNDHFDHLHVNHLQDQRHHHTLPGRVAQTIQHSDFLEDNQHNEVEHHHYLSQHQSLLRSLEATTSAKKRSRCKIVTFQDPPVVATEQDTFEGNQVLSMHHRLLTSSSTSSPSNCHLFFNHHDHDLSQDEGKTTTTSAMMMNSGDSSSYLPSVLPPPDVLTSESDSYFSRTDIGLRPSHENGILSTSSASGVLSCDPSYQALHHHRKQHHLRHHIQKEDNNSREDAVF